MTAKQFKVLKIGLAIFFALFFLTVCIRLFSGEDDWICVDGAWIEHGHPSSAQPTAECGL